MISLKLIDLDGIYDEWDGIEATVRDTFSSDALRKYVYCRWATKCCSKLEVNVALQRSAKSINAPVAIKSLIGEGRNV